MVPEGEVVVKMPIRKDKLVNGMFYHVYNKSISGYVIFNNPMEYSRFIELMKYYRFSNVERKFSIRSDFEVKDNSKKVDIISYCIMPTHYHMILLQKEEKGIERFISSLQKSYALYFNQKHKRKGPLWESRFKNVLIDDNNVFIHLTRYVHLNPVTAGIVNNLEDWEYSSYKQYIGLTESFCEFKEYINMSCEAYKKFSEDQIDYQRELAKI
ncbi:MAG: transposase [Elusimicrobiota bacterium]